MNIPPFSADDVWEIREGMKGGASVLVMADQIGLEPEYLQQLLDEHPVAAKPNDRNWCPGLAASQDDSFERSDESNFLMRLALEKLAVSLEPKIINRLDWVGERRECRPDEFLRLSPRGVFFTRDAIDVMRLLNPGFVEHLEDTRFWFALRMFAPSEHLLFVPEKRVRELQSRLGGDAETPVAAVPF